MSSSMQAGGSLLVGAILSLFAVLGGVAAITPGANASSASDNVVVYDAP
jgi:hypothetical protein